jgi:hypothetical protein
MQVCYEPHFYAALRAAGYVRAAVPMIDDLPRGAIVAVCELKDVARIDRYVPSKNTTTDMDLAGPFLNFGSYGESLPDEPELSFGDYTIGRYAWLLTNVRALPEPIPAKGQLGLWEWDGEL